MSDNVNVRMMKTTDESLVTIVMRHEDGKPLSSQDIVDALCDYLAAFNSTVRELDGRT